MKILTKTTTRKTIKKGYTLLEIMLVMAIILSGVTWLMASWTQENESLQVEQFKEFVNSSLKAAMRANDPSNNATNSYANLTSTYIAERKMVPGKFINMGPPIDLAPPVGTGAVISYTTAGGNVDTLTVTVTAVPQKYCAAIVAAQGQLIADQVKIGGLVADASNVTTVCSGDVDIDFIKNTVDSNFY